MSRIIKIAVVPELQPRELILEEFSRFRAIHHLRIPRKSNFRVEPPDEIQSEGVKCAYPHGRRRIPMFARDPLGHLAGGLVGKCENQDLARIDSLFNQPFDTRGKCLGLACPGPSFEKIGLAAMARGQTL